MDILLDPSLLATFFLLVGLELVLGIDNIIIISIITSKLPVQSQEKARRIGLLLALAMRIILLLGVSWIQKLTEPLIYGFNGRDLFLLCGGLFLIYKAVKEMHYVVEKFGLEDDVLSFTGKNSFAAVITQIVLLDIVFSIDSIITAIGLTNHIVLIILAVILSFVIVLFFANYVSRFVHDNPTIKILALAFLVCIGVTICLEAFGSHVPKAYIYLPMGFGLVVELLQLRYTKKRDRLNR